ncbi:hypothetical protein OOK31_07075 [Streptomyces sp. NBC_00249]|uniref:hypothetical protein n=1 Tax=Streptomyces sp. NBC_00249 TaxID=2975690 RepID=UPI00225A0890|nr:hypothetical protein [Streptomyces sp. NBC_00249]MCX5193656.1 hypothetical protein [Streptomyces sp. NBC_00249]
MSAYPPVPGPAPKQGMSTGKKIALGCGIPAVFGLVVVGGCTALVGKAASDASKDLDKNFNSESVDQNGAKKTEGDGASALSDVKVASCGVEENQFGDLVKASIEITNHTKTRYSYIVEGELLLNDKKISDLNGFTQNLATGQVVTEEFTGHASDLHVKSSDRLTCKVIKVTRSGY